MSSNEVEANEDKSQFSKERILEDLYLTVKRHPIWTVLILGYLIDKIRTPRSTTNVYNNTTTPEQNTLNNSQSTP